MFDKIHKLINIICEGGGAVVEITESPLHDDREELEPDNEDEEDELKEELFTKRVEHSIVKNVRNRLGGVDGVANLHNNANLIKARIKARTPQANLARKQSMMVRRRKIDGDR